MYSYILVCTFTYLDVQNKNGMYTYILVCTHPVTGFRGKHRDTAMLEEAPMSLGLLSSQNMAMRMEILLPAQRTTSFT